MNSIEPRSKFDSGRIAKPLADRIWPRVKISKDPDGCWEWTGARVHGPNKKNLWHGIITVGSRRNGTNRVRGVHRVVWELTAGPIPDGLYVLHKCDNPICVNPKHLFLGTHADNMADMGVKGRTGTRPKLTESQVREIRSLYASGMRKSDIAKKFGVTGPNISALLSGHTWGHVK